MSAKAVPNETDIYNVTYIEGQESRYLIGTVEIVTWGGQDWLLLTRSKNNKPILLSLDRIVKIETCDQDRFEQGPGHYQHQQL